MILLLSVPDTPSGPVSWAAMISKNSGSSVRQPAAPVTTAPAQPVKKAVEKPEPQQQRNPRQQHNIVLSDIAMHIVTYRIIENLIQLLQIVSENPALYYDLPVIFSEDQHNTCLLSLVLYKIILVTNAIYPKNNSIIYYLYHLLLQSFRPQRPRDNRTQEPNSRFHDDQSSQQEEKKINRYPDSQQVFVGNLPHNISDSCLKKYFEGVFRIISYFNAFLIFVDLNVHVVQRKDYFQDILEIFDCFSLVVVRVGVNSTPNSILLPKTIQILIHFYC